ncbi:MAG: hypothetical protein ABL993_02450 [Vicinamibacterales bacterium]
MSALRVIGTFVGLFGIALLTDAAGWKVAVAVFLMIYGDNLSRAVAPNPQDRSER